MRNDEIRIQKSGFRMKKKASLLYNAVAFFVMLDSIGHPGQYDRSEIISRDNQYPSMLCYHLDSRFHGSDKSKKHPSNPL